VLSHGYLGVQLFFVISGYCITAAVYGARGKENPVRHFLVRRARRIFPPYWWSMLLVVVLAAGTWLVMKQQWTAMFPMTPVDWLLNVLLLQQPFGAHDVNLVYWSLSIEIQFYLLMALCLWKLERAEFYLIGVTVVSALLISSLRFSLSGNVLAYWPEFACGIAAFYWITGECRWPATPWILAGTAALVAGVFWYRTDGAAPRNGHVSLTFKLLFCLVTAVVLVVSYRFDAAITRRRWSRVLAALGTMSYTLYLVHAPLATRVFNLGERMTGLDGSWGLLYAAASFLVVLVAGKLFYRFCEQPWLSSQRRPKREGHRARAQAACDPAELTGAGARGSSRRP
jgi:peptidoglycan/LPS O-acetylase OafA/YrhL